MNWKKLGLVYCPSGEVSWMRTHAYVPTPYSLDEETIRVFVSFWDDKKVGRLGYVDVSAKNPKEVVSVSENPVLDVGTPGCFDDCGVTPSQVIEHEGALRMYYIGWQVTAKVRYLLFAGLAESHDDGQSFQRVSQAPILDRTNDERYVRSAMTLCREAEGFRAIYVSGNEWIKDGKKAIPKYDLKSTRSMNGKEWSATVENVVSLAEGETGFGRPWMLKEGDLYRLWYSIRSLGENYRVGYAESHNGIDWIRKDDEAGISASSQGWDSEMICFPAVIDTKYGRRMFFNGNNYGETGFGVAILED